MNEVRVVTTTYGRPFRVDTNRMRKRIIRAPSEEAAIAGLVLSLVRWGERYAARHGWLIPTNGIRPAVHRDFEFGWKANVRIDVWDVPPGLSPYAHRVLAASPSDFRGISFIAETGP